MRRLLPALAFVALLAAPARGSTWNEPWHEDVVRNAESFVKVDILESSQECFTARVVKHLAGKETPEQFRVTGFSMLTLGSTTIGSEGAHKELSLKFNTELRYYLFLAHAADTKEGEYLLATPTTGWAKITDEGVHATYRHSYHQALVPEDLYEPSQVAIFSRLHDEPHDQKLMRALLDDELKQAPQDVGEDAGRFFRQHVALECFRCFGAPEDLPLLEPFLASSGYHVQISAVRGLAGVDCEESRARLLSFLEGDGIDFAKVMAVWGLKRLDARESLPRLKELLPSASEEETGFGGNLMDPRVGTHFPRSVKAALEELIAEWEK